MIRFLPYILRSAARNRVRSALTVVGVAIALFLMTGLGAILESRNSAVQGVSTSVLDSFHCLKDHVRINKHTGALVFLTADEDQKYTTRRVVWRPEDQKDTFGRVWSNPLCGAHRGRFFELLPAAAAARRKPGFLLVS